MGKLVGILRKTAFALLQFILYLVILTAYGFNLLKDIFKLPFKRKRNNANEFISTNNRF